MGIYIVHTGDTLGNIASRTGLCIEELVRLNQLGDRTRLSPGLALFVPDNVKTVRRSIEVHASAYPSIPASVLSEMGTYFSFISTFSSRCTAAGTLLVPGDKAIISASLPQYTAPVMTVSNIGENGGFSASLAHRLLRDEALQDVLLGNILSVIEASEYIGVNFNFEYLHTFDRDEYSEFIRRAAEVFHAHGYYLFSTLAPRDSVHQTQLLSAAHDYASHGEYADRVIVAAYDWGYPGSAPQAVSPLDRVRSAIEYALGYVPASKLLMGFSNYACSWSLPWAQGDKASVISDAAAANIAVSAGAAISFDSTAQASFFTYTDAAMCRHAVWFSDARSIQSRLNLVSEYSLAGISLWPANHLNRPLLQILGNMYDPVKIL